MTDSRQRPDLLHARYAGSFASKHAMLVQAWRAVTDAADEANVDELQQQVHRLAGSAPAYGYALLGSLARNVDSQFAEWDVSPPDSHADLAQCLAAPMQALLDCLAAHATDPAAPPR